MHFRNKLYALRASPKTIFVTVTVIVMMSLAVIALPNFVKARSGSLRTPCLYYLRQIEAAKEQWALENHKTNGTMIVQSEVDGYIKSTPVCPQGGTYNYNVVGVSPTCSIPGHELP